MTVPLGTRRVSDVVENTMRQFGDESGVQIDSADVMRWINQACTEIVSKNGILETTASQTTIKGQREYAMPLDILEMRSVEWNLNNLRAVSREEASEVIGSAVNSQGIPEFWYMWANILYIWPSPNKAAVLIIYYIRVPQQVTALSDILPLPDRYYERICEFVMSKSYELDEDWQAHDTQRKMFEEKLLEANNAEFISGGSYPVITEVGYE